MPILPYLRLALPALLVLAVAGLTARAWRRAGRPPRPLAWAILATVAFVPLDWGLNTALPGLGLSFGTAATAGVVIMALFRSALLLVLACGALPVQLLARRRQKAAPRESPTLPTGRRVHRWAGLVLVAWLLNLAFLGLEVDALYVEPFALETTLVTLPAPGLGRPLRIVHITDTHVARTTRRERELVAAVARLQPDVIALTGDYVHLAYLQDPAAVAATRALLAQLHAPLGVYAISGSVDSAALMHDLFDGLDITVLDNQVARLPLEGREVDVVGVSLDGWREDKETLRRLLGQVPPGAYTLLLYHTPDLVEEAAATGVDLYLAGHTHGGQVRIPFYGALVTGSRYGKQYEAGRYTAGPTTLYVSRGLGMEGFTVTPQARLFCRPEIPVLDLVPGE